MDDRKPTTDRDQERTPVPEPHEPPRLIELGSYTDFTQGFGGVTLDASEGTHS